MNFQWLACKPFAVSVNYGRRPTIKRMGILYPISECLSLLTFAATEEMTLGLEAFTVMVIPNTLDAPTKAGQPTTQRVDFSGLVRLSTLSSRASP